MSRWISVYSDVPAKQAGDSDCTADVLLYLDNGMMISGFYSHVDEAWYDHEGEPVDLVHDVTHWMPLPEAPQ